jgi:outer membrane murein-binding lipoprotein Lpp
MHLPKSFKFSLASCVLIFLVLSGCASRPIVDTAGLDMQQYQADMADCEQVAQQVDVGSSVAVSAGLGALIGAAFGLITGDSTAVSFGAGWGAVSGAADGGLSADQERSSVWKNCLYNRGYAVLN